MKYEPYNIYGPVAQLVRACGLYPHGREFESLPAHQKFSIYDFYILENDNNYTINTPAHCS